MTHSPDSSSASNAPGNRFRSLPSVDWVLGQLGEVEITPAVLTALVRDVLTQARSEIEAGETVERAQIVGRARSAIDSLAATRFEPVINGTGVLLHTNLGRAPVSARAASAMAMAASSYLSLEIDPEHNRRGGRMQEISGLLQALTGAEAALVVNNNAAAVLLTLAGLCAGREVVVSRGEAVEIGGGFRIPEVIAQSGCRLVEVGTTNRTYARDYQNAANDATAALLRVHASNFRIEGFRADVDTTELGTVAQDLGVPLIEDLGSGALLDTAQFGLRHEPTISDAILAGVSVVTMSGDKLLGGPQAGIIAGRKELVERIERHPLARAVRADKVTLAGVAATLRHYLDGSAVREIPVWQMLGTSVDELAARAQAIVALVDGPLAVVSTESSAGGGSLPGETLPSVGLAIEAPGADALALRLRMGRPRVFPIIRDGAVLVDLRTVEPGNDLALAQALGSVCLRALMSR